SIAEKACVERPVWIVAIRQALTLQVRVSDKYFRILGGGDRCSHQNAGCSRKECLKHRGSFHLIHNQPPVLHVRARTANSSANEWGHRVTPGLGPRVTRYGVSVIDNGHRTPQRPRMSKNGIRKCRTISDS